MTSICVYLFRFKGDPTTIATPGDGVELSNGSYNFISMNGKEVYKFATREVPRVLEEALEAAEMSADDIDWLLLHQVCIVFGSIREMSF